jgi:hypothetical protein
MAELPAEAAPEPTLAPATTATATAAPEVAAPAAPTPVPIAAPVAAESQVFQDPTTAQQIDQESINRARASLREKSASLPVAAEPAKKQEAQARGVQFDPIPSPALPISAEKQQKLAELNRRYLADEITPDQYHADRARILAQ